MDIVTGDKGVLGFGPYLLDTARRRLTVDGEVVKLSHTPLETLLYLVQNAGRVVDKDELMTAVWGERIIEEGNLSQTIFLLRRALQHGDNNDAYIVTAPGRGYRFAAEVHNVQHIAPTSSLPSPHGITQIGPASAEGITGHLGLETGPGLSWASGRSSIAAAAILTFVSILATPLILAWRSVPGASIPFHTQPPFSPPPHSVAVLAFTNLSSDPNQEYFSDGLSEELIDTLGNVGALRVAARASSFSFKGKAIAISEIARQLNVGAILEGSVRRDATQLRVATRLIDAGTGYELWSNHYDSDAGGSIRLQEQIARAVTAALQVTLLDRDKPKLNLGGTSNPKAFDAFLRGRKFQSANDEDSNHDKEAIAAFDEALAIDPHYALAEAMRAYSLVDRSLWDSGPEGVGKLTDEAIAGATRATRSAPDLGIAHGALAMALGTTNHYAAAQAEYELALRLSPNDAAVKMSYAWYEFDLGFVHRSVEVAQEAVALDPLTSRKYSNLAWFLYMGRQYDEALEVIDHARQLAIGGDMFASGEVGFIHLMKGDPKRALTDCMRESDWIQLSCVAIAYHQLNRTADATKALAAMHALMGDRGAYNYAQVYAQWNQPEEACKWLGIAHRLHDSGLHVLKMDPMLDPIRETRDFKTCAID